LLMRMYWPVVNENSKTLDDTIHVHYLLERGLTSESTK